MTKTLRTQFLIDFHKRNFMQTQKENTQRLDPPHASLPLALLAVFLFACAQPMPETGARGTDGKDGIAGTSCTLVTSDEGVRTLTCEDGTETVLTDGVDGTNGTNGVNGVNGTNGTSCTAADNGDGSKTISCEDGTEVVVKDGAICEVQNVVDNGNGTETLTCVGGFVITIASRIPIDACILAARDAAAPWQTASPQVLGVCVDSFTVVFTSFEKGSPRTLNLSETSFLMAKLLPGTAGEPDHWKSYLNRTERAGVWTAASGKEQWPVTDVTTIQATRENNGTLRALSPGVYAYTFKANIKSITSTIGTNPTAHAVSYQPSLTHRVGIEFRGSLEDLGAGNLWLDFRPDGAAVNHTRLVATTASCKTCHEGFSAHGGRAKDVEVCVLCHNPGTIDSNSGNTVDMKVMAHKIHSGRNLPSVKAGGEYAIWGFSNTKYNFSALKYPQDTRNCMTCHDGTKTPDGDHWKNKASLATCTSCHENVAFAAEDVTTGVTMHTGGAFTSGCIGCHSPGGPAKDIATAHRTIVSTPNNPAAGCRVWGVNKTCAQEFPVIEYDLIEVTLSGDPATWVTVKFAILADGVGMDINNLPTGVELYASTTMRLLRSNASMYGNLAAAGLTNPADFNTNTYTNLNLAGLRAAAVHYPADGTYSVLLGSVAANAVNIGVGIEGRATVDGQIITVASAIKGLGLAESPRRQIAETNKCLACHERLDSFGHGATTGLGAAVGNAIGYRVNDVDYCTVCHNPTRTTSAHRPTSMAYMTHRIHSGKHEGRTNVHYPNNIADCTTCHTERSLNAQGLPIAGTGTYELPIPVNALAMSLRRDFTERVSPTGGACIACHDSPQAKLHANAASAVDGLFSAATDQCSVCHGPGASFDVQKVHKLK
jgi:OmcA/MtrC family decaheme c-type cytochrome